MTSTTSPATGAEQLGDGLHRLHGAEDLVRLQLAAHLGQLEEDHVAELLLRVVGDADASRGRPPRGPTRGPSCSGGPAGSMALLARLYLRAACRTAWAPRAPAPRRPRTSTSNSVPDRRRARPAGSRGRCSSAGTARRCRRSRRPPPRRRRARGSRGARCRAQSPRSPRACAAGRAFFCAASTARPGKSPLASSRETIQPRPASTSVVVSSMSFP